MWLRNHSVFCEQAAGSVTVQRETPAPAGAIHLGHFSSFLLLLPPRSGSLNHFSGVNTSPFYSGFSEFIFPLQLPASLRNLKPRQFEIYQRADLGCFAELDSARHS